MSRRPSLTSMHKRCWDKTPHRIYSVTPIEGNGWDGVKELAATVVLKAISDCQKTTCSIKERRSAENFLQGRTEGLIRGESMLEFCCGLAGVEASSVWNGVWRGKKVKRGMKKEIA